MMFVEDFSNETVKIVGQVWSPGFSRPGLAGRGIIPKSLDVWTRCRLKPGLHAQPYELLEWTVHCFGA
jgi:hypothetical protein